MTQKQRDKFGEFLFDIAKYIITAVLLATWFKGVNEWSWYMFLLPMSAAFVAIVTATYLFKDKHLKKNKNKRR